MITYYYKTTKGSPFKKVSKLIPGAWVHIEITPENTDQIVKEFNLNPDIVTDALDQFEVPRIEQEKGVEYIFTRYPVETDGKVSTSPILICVTKNYFITISSKPFELLERFEDGKVVVYTNRKTQLLIQIALEINASYQKKVNNINKKIRNATNNLEEITNKDLSDFVGFERVFNDFLTSLQETNIILGKMLSGKHLKLYDEDRDLIEDLFLDNNQLIEMCKSSLKHIVNVREAYSTIASNNLNRTMKLLTSLTLILTIPTMIASFYGMNVHLPFEGSPLAFPSIIIITIGITTTLLYYFSKRDLL